MRRRSFILICFAAELMLASSGCHDTISDQPMRRPTVVHENLVIRLAASAANATSLPARPETLPAIYNTDQAQRRLVAERSALIAAWGDVFAQLVASLVPLGPETQLRIGDMMGHHMKEDRFIANRYVDHAVAEVECGEDGTVTVVITVPGEQVGQVLSKLAETLEPRGGWSSHHADVMGRSWPGESDLVGRGRAHLDPNRVPVEAPEEGVQP